MGYPKTETIQAYLAICEKDGFVNIMEEFTNKDLKPEHKPIFAYLKKIISDLMDDETISDECVDYYTTGFLSCFDLFRRQIESEEATLEDLEMQLQNMIGWTTFLESENINLTKRLQDLNEHP